MASKATKIVSDNNANVNAKEDTKRMAVGAADNNYKISAISLEQYFDKETDKPVMEVANHKTVAPLSIELEDGMVIKAFDTKSKSEKVEADR